MGTVVEVVVAADEFALQHTSEALPEISFRLERVIAQNPEHVMPFIWVTDVDQDAFEDALSSDSSVEAFELVTDLNSRWLYQMNWVDRIETLVRTIVEEEAVLLEAQGSRQAWELKFLFLEHDAIGRVQDHFEDVGMSFDPHRIYNQREGALGARGLTEKQHNVLTRALDLGYYTIPRETNAVGLATDLGISHQALSEQLRRAHEAIVADAVGMPASVLSDESRPDE